jgi:hypothetical protein
MDTNYKKLEFGSFDDSLGSFLVSTKYDSSRSLDGNYDSTAERPAEPPHVYKIIDIAMPKGIDLIACAFGMCNGCGQDCASWSTCGSYD